MKNPCVSLVTEAAAVLSHGLAHGAQTRWCFNLKVEISVAAVVKQNSQQNDTIWLPNIVKCFQFKHVWLVIQLENGSVKLIEIGLVSLTDFP